jgi:hypothetical protein
MIKVLVSGYLRNNTLPKDIIKVIFAHFPQFDMKLNEKAKRIFCNIVFPPLSTISIPSSSNKPPPKIL